MVNPINNDDAALMLSKFGTKYLAEGAHTDVSASQFVAQAATTLTVLTGGDAAISDNSKDYLASMSLGSVELKAGALIVAPNGESFKSITVATGGALVAYNSVVEGVKPGSFVGLLDTYPDAAAAYSLRRLRANYSGSAIRVRRTDNTEQDIGFLNNELDTTSLLSFVGSGDGFVATWYDQSGNGKDFSISAANLQPSIVNNGSVILDNSKPSVAFNGTSNYLTSPSLNLGNTTTYFNVYRGLTDGTEIPFDGDSSTNRQLPIFMFGNKFNINGGASAASGQASNLNQNLHVTSFDTLDNTFTNGVQEITNANTGNHTVTGALMANNFNLSLPAHIKMQELIIYNSNKLTDRSAIEKNINDFYLIY